MWFGMKEDMHKNNFQQLEEELVFDPQAVDKIEQDLVGQMHFARCTGNIIELYLPKLWQLVLSFLGSNPQEKK